MKDVVLHEGRAVALQLPADALAGFALTRAAVKARTAIVWGEHCSECAFPACYTSCAFYAPREDLHCRRFANGIERIALEGLPEALGLTRIRFRKWGKLEGHGPARMLPLQAADDAELRAEDHDTLLSSLPLPRRAATYGAHRLNLTRKAQATRDPAPLSDAAHFLLEAWLEHPGAVALTLSILPESKSEDGLFQQPVRLDQGYNRILIPVPQIRRSVSLDRPFLVQVEVVGAPPAQPIVFGLVDFLELSAPLANTQPATPATKSKTASKTAKCVIWDLDDTLWHGTLVEDGVEGVTLRPDMAEAMRMLDARGILNSVASKNDEALALAALERFGLRDLVLFPQISWEPKSNSIRQIAASLDIGIDTFAFVDDQPFERAEVAAAHPSVAIFTPEDVATLATHPLFDVPATAESGRRRLMYRDEERRQTAATGAGTDYLGFLRNSNIVLEVGRVTRDNAERVYELTQRTNQLNVTGARFSRDDVEAFLTETSKRKGYVLRCADAFGDYGVIGFCVMSDARTIDAFFMSCRVQRKRVEHAFLAWLGARADAGALKIAYRKTAKNAAAVKMFEDLGFELVETAPGEGAFTRDVNKLCADADIVRIDAPAFTRQNQIEPA